MSSKLQKVLAGDGGEEQERGKDDAQQPASGRAESEWENDLALEL